jgi:hypothetical protein
VLIDSYRDYRAWLHARDLQQADHLPDDSQFQPARAAVTALWDLFFPSPHDVGRG